MTHQERAEELYESIGGDLCICQRADVPHWCERCQGRIQLIREALASAACQGETSPQVTAQAKRDALKRIETAEKECACGKGVGCLEVRSAILNELDRALKAQGEASPQVTAHIQALSDLCEEVWLSHRDKDDAEYNECEKDECAWCEETKRHIAALKAPGEATGTRLVICSRNCAHPRRDRDQEHPGVCECGGFLTDVIRKE